VSLWFAYRMRRKETLSKSVLHSKPMIGVQEASNL
jgi:hypothetical protein